MNNWFNNPSTSVNVNGVNITVHGGVTYVNGQPVEPGPRQEPETVNRDFTVARDPRLVLSTSAAKVSVEPSLDGDQSIRVSLTGEPNMIESVRVHQHGNVVTVQEDASSGTSFVSIGDSRVVTTGGNVYIGSAAADALEITITVPRGTAIRAETKGIGTIAIGAVAGPVEARASGTGDIFCREVVGEARLVSSGTGCIRVNDGEVTRLYAKSSGTGGIDVLCIVHDAELKASGIGDIWVSRSLTAPRISTSGLGKAKVGTVG